MNPKMPRTLFVIGWLLVVSPAVILSITLMPILPGAQEWDSLSVSYFVYQVSFWALLVGIGLMAYGLVRSWKRSPWLWKSFLVLSVLVAGGIQYLSKTEMSAEVIFNEPSKVVRLMVDSASLVSDTTVYLWVEQNGQIAGYPLDLVAHHHKILDTVGGVPVMVTYCTMCHSGRVYSQIVGAKPETFRLVGAHRYNAMFEDLTSGSWWYQATGECVIGPRKGELLTELPFLQTTAEQMMQVSKSRSMSMFVADPATGTKYEWSEGFARYPGDTSIALSKRSLVLGVIVDRASRAYPILMLRKHYQGTVFIDTISGVPISWRVPAGNDEPLIVFRDSISSGIVVQSYLDYWHSWQHFYPSSDVWKMR